MALRSLSIAKSNEIVSISLIELLVVFIFCLLIVAFVYQLNESRSENHREAFISKTAELGALEYFFGVEADRTETQPRGEREQAGVALRRYSRIVDIANDELEKQGSDQLRYSEAARLWETVGNIESGDVVQKMAVELDRVAAQAGKAEDLEQENASLSSALANSEARRQSAEQAQEESASRLRQAQEQLDDLVTRLAHAGIEIERFGQGTGEGPGPCLFTMHAVGPAITRKEHDRIFQITIEKNRLRIEKAWKSTHDAFVAQLTLPPTIVTGAAHHVEYGSLAATFPKLIEYGNANDCRFQAVIMDSPDVTKDVFVTGLAEVERLFFKEARYD